MSKNQALVCPIPSAWKDFLQERSSVFFSSPPHNLVLCSFLPHNNPSAPATVGQRLHNVSTATSKLEKHKSHILFFTFISGWKIKNQNWGPGLFQSFFCESPQKPCLFLFASSQSKTSGFFTWKKSVRYFWPKNQSLVWEWKRKNPKEIPKRARGGGL